MIQDARGLAWGIQQTVVRRIELDEVVVDNPSEATQRIRLLCRAEVTVAEQEIEAVPLAREDPPSRIVSVFV
ncbi:MAG: hypothetical protein ACRD1T_00870 [Acidimicrobiia bacterium]